VADWSWEYLPDAQLVSGLSPEVIKRIERAADEIAVGCSLGFPEGADYQGLTPPLRTHALGPDVLLTYLVDVRGEQVLVVQVAALGF
jgi:hypothetical protein